MLFPLRKCHAFSRPREVEGRCILAPLPARFICSACSGGQTSIALPLIPGHTLALGSIPGCHTGIEGIRIRATLDNDPGTRMAQENGLSVERTLGETLDCLQRLFHEARPAAYREQPDTRAASIMTTSAESVTRVYSLPTTRARLHSVPSWTHIRGILFLLTLVGRHGLLHKPDQRWCRLGVRCETWH